MSFPRYPRYKVSGVEWLGEVPGHWDVKRIGYYFNERREKVSDKDYPALSVTKNGIVPQLDTAAKSDDGDNRKRVCKGDFVINSRSDRKGSSGASNLDGSVSLICTVLQTQEHVHTPFVHHLLRSQPFQEEFYRNGKGIVADLWSTNYSEMRNILLGMPPLAEQTAIATFLDRETAKIDELVSEQRRLMELLKEKRQVVISHAVTHGLSPDVPFKPSGIDWLGEVPRHWEVKRLKHLVTESVAGPYGASLTKAMYSCSGYRVYGQQQAISNDFTVGDYFIEEEKYEEMRRYTVYPKDVLISVMGTIGKVAVVPDNVEPGIINPRLVRYRCAKMILPHFLRIVLMSAQQQELLGLESNGSTMDGLNMKILGDVPIQVPPLTEQHAILNYLDVELVKFDALTAETQQAIDLLQERRTALISAAVTGQIDVRDLSPLTDSAKP